MSADLFAEFGSSDSNAPASQQQRQQAHSSTSTFSLFDDLRTTPVSVPTQQTTVPTPSNAQQDADEDDDWGEFEGDTASFERPPLLKQDSFAFVAAAATRARAPTLSTAHEHSGEATWQRAPVFKAKKSADPSVLFDAEGDFDNDDDFGEFEGTEPISLDKTKPTVGSSGIADLLGDLTVQQPASESKTGQGKMGLKSTTSITSKSSRGAFGSVTTSQRAISKTTLATPTEPKEEDAWDTFDDWEASIPSQAPAKVHSQSKLDGSEDGKVSHDLVSPPPILSPTFNDPQPGELPPTNVPPPAVLLSLFPPLFAEAQEKLFKPMAAQALPMRNKVLAEPATIMYLQGYTLLATVAAHIIAGRKLRWKRDQHLSQGMRIGPASSRATSGMKLSSIDKSETMKEEREASDVVRAWKDQIGRLRHVVSAANQIRAGSLDTVPDLQETMPVKVLKQGEGGVPAKEPCMLCGLKRDERVGAVDHGVEDSFGEWWIDQVNMHRSCRNFWDGHRDGLRQR